MVRLLSDHALVVMSGTKLADELGISRSEVWRLVEQLRALGVDVEGYPATGYQLRRVPDLLLPEIVDSLIHGTRFAGQVHHYFKIPSTSTAAMQAAAEGAPEGTVFLAEEQTAGRGRGDHKWESARSAGIYCSAVLRPPLPPADVLVLSLAAGLAVAGAVEAVTGLRPDLRWPNDVLLGGKKFCGILTELNAEATRVRYAVVGIGINVNHATAPKGLEQLATSLRMESGREWSRVELSGALLKSLDREYGALLREARAGRQEMVRRFQERSSYARGKRVRVEEDGGYTGLTDGLDERGFLRVREDDGRERLVLSGGVREV